MERHFVTALLSAWDKPEFRAALQHLIDLDEVSALLAALAAGNQDDQAERRLLELLRSALETDDIRRAVLLLLDDEAVREAVAQGTEAELPGNPGLAHAIRSALGDPKVRQEIHAALESPRIRKVVWDAAESRIRDRSWKFVWQVSTLLMRHRSARRLAWALKRHGVLRHLWRGREQSQPA